MGFQQPLQAGPMGQPRKEGVIVPLQSAVEGVKVAALEGEQETNRQQFTRPQPVLAGFRQRTHATIGQAEQMYDKIFRSHGSLLLLR